MIALFGGTFDPVHSGHLHLAREVVDAFPFTKLYFVPARQNPLKAAHPSASASQRLEMLELAITEATDPRFAVLDWEVAKADPSYTIDTVERCLATLGQTPTLVMGNEVFGQLPQWREPKRLLELVDIVIAARSPQPHSHLAKVLSAVGISGVSVQGSHLEHSKGKRWIELFPLTPLPISATTVREGWARFWRGAGAPPSGLPVSVVAYIKQNRLYADLDR